MSEAEPERAAGRDKPIVPLRDAAARQAFMAIGLVFVVGLVLGFVLGRTL
jgi:hypothetical protein